MGDPVESYCVPLCVYDRKECKKPMVRCCLCIQWYHLECVGLNKDDNGVWCCPYCRTLCKDVSSMKDSQAVMLSLIQKMSDQIATLTKTINNVRQNSQMLLEDKNRECMSLRETNADLRERLAQVTSHQSVRNWEGFTHRPALLIGDSSIRNVNQAKLKDTEVMCIPGGRISDVTDTLKSKVGPYRYVTICVGTNDCSDCIDDNDEFPTLVPKFEKLISAAMCITPKPENVILSSLLPRCDDEKVISIIDDINEDLSVLAEEKHISFINNDPDFKLLSGKANDAMLLNDGIHLTHKGTFQLATNLHLQFVDNTEKNKGSNVNKKPLKRHSPGHGSYQKFDRGPRRSSTTAIDDPQQKHSSGDRESSHKFVGTRYHRTPNSPHVYPYRNPLRSGPCWYCGERNHAARSCRHGKPLQCNACSNEGHKSKFCSQISDC